jgi:hypothetical protein
LIFPYIESDKVVQVGDKFRISAVKSYTTKDESKVTLVEIQPEASAPFFVVGSYPLPADVPKPADWFLDYAYQSDNSKLVTVRITTNAAPVLVTKNIESLTEAQDMLWSSDDDLTAHEPDILKWVPVGRNSFKNIHRKSQTHILEWLDATRVWRTDGSRIEKQDLKITSDVKELSTYLTLHFIFRGLQNTVDDVFAQKAKDYEILSEKTKGRGRIQADLNQNNTIEKSEQKDIRSLRMVRR